MASRRTAAHEALQRLARAKDARFIVGRVVIAGAPKEEFVARLRWIEDGLFCGGEFRAKTPAEAMDGLLEKLRSAGYLDA